MPLHSWDHFGGHNAEQGGKGFSEAVLKQWADDTGFSSVQAQANLCTEAVYASSYRRSLVFVKELMASAVQKYNKAAQSGKVSMIKLKVNPMHLLVQHAFCNSKVSLLAQKRHRRIATVKMTCVTFMCRAEVFFGHKRLGH